MRSFHKLGIVTLIAVYVLILVGGIVRSSGSGMGCPDWPTCFGKWTPPTTVEELPEDYKEDYVAYRHKKNVRFAKFLSSLGFEETAAKIVDDKSIQEETEFNATKTWIEYINRLVGVIIGILIVAMFVSSIRFWRTQRIITWFSFLAFILVVIQGWFGSIVVSTNLTPWTVTLHMFLAMLIVFFLVYLVHQSSVVKTIASSQSTKFLLAGCILVLTIQILLGTQVREAIDRIASLARSTWIDNVGIDFIIHRSFSWVVLLINAAFVVKLYKERNTRVFPAVVAVLVLATMLTGIGMAYLSVPPALQPIHLLLATGTFGFQLFLFLELRSVKVITTGA